MVVIHYLPEPDNGKTACGLDVLKVRYHTYRKQDTTCKSCKLAKRFLKKACNFGSLRMKDSIWLT